MSERTKSGSRKAMRVQPAADAWCGALGACRADGPLVLYASKAVPVPGSGDQRKRSKQQFVA